jgi:hypothetical protein
MTARAAPSEAHPRLYRPALIAVPADIEAAFVGFDYVRRFAEPADRGKVIVKVTIDRDSDGDGSPDATQRLKLRCSVRLPPGFENPFCTESRQVGPLGKGDLVSFVFRFKQMPRSPTAGRIEFFGWGAGPRGTVGTLSAEHGAPGSGRDLSLFSAPLPPRV